MNTSLDLADYYSGGYFLIRADKSKRERTGWEETPSDLLPEKMISLSTCLCPQLSVYWSWAQISPSWAISFGIPEAKFNEFVQWCGKYPQTEISSTSMFYSVDAARRFVDRFLPNTDGLYLIGAGLYKRLEAGGLNLLPEQIRIKRALTVNLLLQTESVEIESLAAQIDLHLLLEAGGTLLGFEVVSYADNTFGSSWICSGIHEEMYKLFGIRPGQYGLLQSREDAEKVNDWISEDVERAVTEPYGPPEPHAYWLLVSYPLS